MVMVSPLHSAITAGQWDAERLLGRLIVLVHAAFLDAGFVPLARDPCPAKVPRKAGRTASALSLRYGAPQLLHRHDAEAVVLGLLVHGSRHLILYVKCDPWPVERCVVLVDALAAAPLLSGGLDATARALRRDARLAALWRRLSDDLCRRALVVMCRRGGVALEGPTFMSLPGDAKAAVLSRLATGADLASVELVCTALRRLVAERDRQLWKPRYDALARRGASCLLPGELDCFHSPETSWKERYVTARRWKLPQSPLGTPGHTEVMRYYEYSFQGRLYDVEYLEAGIDRVQIQGFNAGALDLTNKAITAGAISSAEDAVMFLMVKHDNICTSISEEKNPAHIRSWQQTMAKGDADIKPQLPVDAIVPAPRRPSRIQQVVLASYGNPEGICSTYTAGSCQTPHAKEVAASSSTQYTCMLSVSAEVYGSDIKGPGTTAAVAVQAKRSKRSLDGLSAAARATIESVLPCGGGGGGGGGGVLF
nr:unnamed protein product [Digitaria exilis]